MAKKAADLQEKLEAALGHDFAADLRDDVIAVRSDVALYSSENQGQSNGYVTSRDIGTTGSSTKACVQASILDVSGVSRTGSDGIATIQVRDFICGEATIASPLNLVATPLSRAAVIVTTRRSRAANGDVLIQLLTWNPAGAPAPNVPVDWRFRARYYDRVS